MTDFIYEECGSESDGLLAVMQDGKWGYVNTEGEVVIPIEYDGSWKGLPFNDPATGELKEMDYCYAFFRRICAGLQRRGMGAEGHRRKYRDPGGNFRGDPAGTGRQMLGKEGRQMGSD